MRTSDDPAQTPSNESGPQVRSAFLRAGTNPCHWPEAFAPVLDHEDPAVTGLAERLWQMARPTLESSDARLNRLTFKQAVDQAGSDLFSQAEVGIKALTAAKQLLGDAFAEIAAACDVDVAAESAEPPPWEAPEPTLVARLAATPPAQTPGQARLCLSLADVVLTVELQVPRQSWLYQGYRRLQAAVARGIAASRMAGRPGRWGMITDDRELTVGLRHQRRPDGERRQRETTISLRSRR